jgi:ribonuclease HII
MKRAGELIAGVDEAGRGPLAGPVVCAAVILHPRRRIAGLADSKALCEQEREALFPIIQKRCLAWTVVFVEREEIDTLNNLWATMEGMRRAVVAMVPAATRVLIDGDRVPPGLPCPGNALVKGDSLEPAIMAASILAKVSRDRHMAELHRQFPDYGFDRNKGYATREHFASLARVGPCAQHRRSFAPVRDCQLPLFAPDEMLLAAVD